MNTKCVLKKSTLAILMGVAVIPTSIAMTTNSHSEVNTFNVSEAETFDGIAQQMATYIDANNEEVSEVGSWLTPISEGGLFDPSTGQWSDIDYTSSTAAAFPVVAHLERLLNLTRCYTSSQCGQSEEQELLSVISSGMQQFADAEYTHSGWWFNYIGIPHRVGELLVYVKAYEIPVAPSAYQALVNAKYLNARSHWSYGRGANAIDIAIANMYSGVVRENEERLAYYSNEALKEIGRSDIGINADKSFFAHGPMLNTNSYGWVLVMRTLQVEAYTRGYYSMNSNSQNALESFMDQGMYPTFRGRYHDYLTGGRGGVSRENNLGRGFSTDTLERLNPDRAAHFHLVNQVTSGQATSDQMPYRDIKGYWNGDYLLKNTQSYQYSALTHSNRTMAIEQGNGENLLGSLMSMGSHSIRVSGDEYYNIFPLWDWLKIPGVTGRQGQSMYQGWNTRGIAFSGVMSADNNAIMVHSQNKFGVSVKKANFVFDDAIIAMSSDVTSTQDGLVTTSLDQSWYRDEVKIGYTNGDSDVLTNGTQSYTGNQLAYVLHNGIAYMPLDNSLYNVSVEDRTGQWTRVNASQSDRDITGTVFTSWIDHGAYPTNQSFSYAIYPGQTSTSVSTLAPRNRFATFQEGDTLVAYDRQDDVLQLVLREAGQWSHDEFTLVSDQPGMYIVTNASSSQPTLHFADPDQANGAASVGFYNSHGGASEQVSAPNYQQTNVSTVTLNMGDVTVQPDLVIDASDDTFVRFGGYSNDNYGSSNKLSVKADSNSSYRRHVLLKFPIDQVNISALNTATLELSVLNSGSSQPVVAYKVDDQAWEESSVTANSAPNSGDQIAAETNNNGVFRWDISQVLRDASSQERATISIKLLVANNGQSNWITFNSKESTETGPVINIDYDPIVEQVNVVEDAYLQGGSSANTNFGQDARLIVKLDPNSSSYTRESVLKFPISHLNSSALNLAELSLQVKNIGQAMTLRVAEIDSSWSEGDVTYNNLNRGTSNPIASNLTTQDQVVSINITDLVKAALEQGKEQISLRLYSLEQGGNKYATFYSKDSAFEPPRLITSSY
ncbi:CBM96 family carbohydrate-binding protein [Vibrio penaeicida]|uniref:CBM96 family carbohydrate-binding protein n=1 Tax=Vibrio penaeicida TaxID=104609 RepID=UPI000CE9B69B|nr:polysaccharide lyase family 8 super-sandwich domain-containing protein [Vibrio penaeicida]